MKMSTGTARRCCASQIPRFYNLKVRGNRVSRDSVTAIFLTAFVHFMSLGHVLVILAIVQTFSSLLYVLVRVSVIRDL